MVSLIKLVKKYKYIKSRIIKKRLQEKILFEKRLQKFYSSGRKFAKKKKFFLTKYLLL